MSIETPSPDAGASRVTALPTRAVIDAGAAILATWPPAYAGDRTVAVIRANGDDAGTAALLDVPAGLASARTAATEGTRPAIGTTAAPNKRATTGHRIASAAAWRV